MNTRTNLAFDLNTLLLNQKATEQFYTGGPDNGGDEAATMLFGKAVKNKAWGRINEVPLIFGTSMNMEPANASNRGFPEAGALSGARADIQPVTQFGTISFDDFAIETLLKSSGESYLMSRDQIIKTYFAQMNEIQAQQLAGRNDGRLCYVIGSGTTATFYGLDGTKLLSAENPAFDILTGPSRKFDIVPVATKTVPSVAGCTFSAFDLDAMTATCSSSLSGISSSDTDAYYVRCYNSKTAITAIQADGLLDIFESAGSYLTDNAGAAITSTLFPNWRVTRKSAGSAVLSADIVEYLLAASLKLPGSDKILVADPKVLVRCQNANKQQQQFKKDEGLYLGFPKVFYMMGAGAIQVVGLSRWRGTGYVAVVDRGYLRMLGTAMTPRFMRNEFQLLEESADWINNVKINSQMYTDCLRAHAMAYGVDNTTDIG